MRQNSASLVNSGSWIQTIIGAVTAISVVTAGGWTVGIVPLQQEIRDGKEAREKDRVRLEAAYTLIQTNDEYKKRVEDWRADIRRDVNKIEAAIARVDDEQRRRASTVASVDSVIKRIDRIDLRTEESERRSAPLLIDEVKALRAELESLRQRIMVPITAK